MSDTATDTGAAPISILIVDDSAMMRTMIRRAAMLTGKHIAQIHEAGDGRQALAVLEAHHVDAMFTDINMPVMTGIELLRRVADDSRWTHVVRVIISTDGSNARRAEADALDVHHYVEKPFRPEVMRDVLNNLAPTL